MKTEEFVEFLASAPSLRDESHRITQSLIDVLLEAPEEVQLRKSLVQHVWHIRRCGHGLSMLELSAVERRLGRGGTRSTSTGGMSC